MDLARVTAALEKLAEAQDGTSAWAATKDLSDDEKAFVEAIRSLIDRRIESDRRQQN